MPLPSVSDEVRTGRVAVIELSEKDWVRPVGVLYRSDRSLSLAAKKFVQILETPDQV
jgi:DNA-binding transcriptional LysR family regulator